jgi:hypothetical protein
MAISSRIVVVNFIKHNPPAKAVNKEVRDGGRLKWIRWMTDWYEDEDVMSLPEEERFLWPFLCARAGRSQPVGTIHDSPAHLAHLAHTTEGRVVHALDHLATRKRIRGWRIATLPVVK